MRREETKKTITTDGSLPTKVYSPEIGDFVMIEGRLYKVTLALIYRGGVFYIGAKSAKGLKLKYRNNNLYEMEDIVERIYRFKGDDLICVWKREKTESDGEEHE